MHTDGDNIMFNDIELQIRVEQIRRAEKQRDQNRFRQGEQFKNKRK